MSSHSFTLRIWRALGILVEPESNWTRTGGRWHSTWFASNGGHEAFDGQAKPFLRSEDLRRCSRRIRLALQPYVQLLELRYPVDDLLLAVKTVTMRPDFTSNAVQHGKDAARSGAVANWNPRKFFLAVHRLDYFVYFADPAEDFFCSALCGSGKNDSSAPSN